MLILDVSWKYIESDYAPVKERSDVTSDKLFIGARAN